MSTTTMTSSELLPARLAPRDVFRIGAAGLRTRPARALLSALGIAIGIAAMIAVVGISSSSHEELDRRWQVMSTLLASVGPSDASCAGRVTRSVGR